MVLVSWGLYIYIFITMLWFECSYPRQTFRLHILFISLAFLNSIWWEILFSVHLTPIHVQRSESLLFTLQSDRVGVVAGSICHVSAEGFACVWHVMFRVSVCQQWKGGDWMVKASELLLFGSSMEGTHVSRDTQMRMWWVVTCYYTRTAHDGGTEDGSRVI